MKQLNVDGHDTLNPPISTPGYGVALGSTGPRVLQLRPYSREWFVLPIDFV